MKIEYPAAFNYILTDDLFLLDTDRAFFAGGHIVTAKQGTPKTVFNYSGGNKKSYLVITFYDDEEHIAAPHRAALENTLKRLGYEMDDIAILNLYKHQEIPFNEIKLFFSPQKLLILGSNALPGGLESAKLNKPGKVGKINTLLTYSFAEMMTDNDKKKLFWEQVKQL